MNIRNTNALAIRVISAGSSKIPVFLLVQLLLALRCLAEPPQEWVEPATGHRVVRLSRDAGSSSFYFHQNAYTAEGDKLLISTPSGLATVNLTNYAIEVVVPSAG